VADEFDLLRQQIQQLKLELETAKRQNAELEQKVKGASTPAASGEVSELPVAVSEIEETLRRVVQRTAMIVQAEKCVIVVRDRETGGLAARTPAYGLTDEQIKAYRVEAGKGISGEVFTAGVPGSFHTADDPRALEEGLLEIGIRNGIVVPLIVERRDEQNHIVERLNIGVLCCFNKRFGGDFIDEDVRLLERLSRNAAAVIANAQMFQEVVEEKQKLVHTLESLTAGLILINQHERIGQMNVKARTMFSVPDETDPIGNPYIEIVRHEECQAIIKRNLAKAQGKPADGSVETEEAQPDEISVYDKDQQEYIYQVHSAVVHDDAGAPIGVVFLFNDITDLRNVERMKTEFVSIVSHELRTPLTPMKGFVRTLLDDENEEWYMKEDRREFYTIIDDNVDRLGRLINDLLNVSRIERMGAEGLEINWSQDVDLRRAVEDVAAMQRGRTDKHTLVVDFEPGVITAETDPDLIHNVLHNLISNAIKYSPGGEIRLIGRIEPETDGEPESILLGVKDQGIGLTEAQLKKVGEKFYRTEQSRSAGGTGIGLFLVTAIAKRHHGKIYPESDGLNKGSTFWFKFPRQQPKEDTVGETAQEEVIQ
jgi:signal transduction histidine kinase